jgi:hypothetical protein
MMKNMKYDSGIQGTCDARITEHFFALGVLICLVPKGVKLA